MIERPVLHCDRGREDEALRRACELYSFVAAQAGFRLDQRRVHLVHAADGKRVTRGALRRAFERHCTLTGSRLPAWVFAVLLDQPDVKLAEVQR